MAHCQAMLERVSHSFFQFSNYHNYHKMARCFITLDYMWLVFSCFCQVVPARGMANVNFSFTPFPTEEVVRDMDCNGYALGYMSLDKVMLSPLKLLTFVSDYQETLNL